MSARILWPLLAAVLSMFLTWAQAPAAETPVDRDYQFAGITWDDDVATVETKLGATGLFPRQLRGWQESRPALAVEVLGSREGELVARALRARDALAMLYQANQPGLIRQAEIGFSPGAGREAGRLLYTKLGLVEVKGRFAAPPEHPFYQALVRRYGPPAAIDDMGGAAAAFRWVKGAQVISLCLADQTLMYLNLERFREHGGELA